MDRQQAQNIIKETFENPFDKERFVGFVKNLLKIFEDAPFSYKGNFIPDAYEQYISSLERIGKYTDGKNKIDILVVKLKKKTSIERARTMQRNFIAWYLNGSRGGEMKDAALAAFVSPNEEDWRFSLVKMDYRFEEGKDGRVKVKEEFTPARRWSFLVGKNEKSFTAQSRLVGILADDKHNPTLSELEEAFNIEKVTKEFFEKYRDLFLRTKETLDEIVSGNQNIKADFEAKAVNTVDFAKKLLGQIVFLYFLQKKGWFGVQRDADWGTGSKHFLRELFDGRHGSYKNFFNDILEPLFYEALRIDRSHDDGYYSRFNCKIPFLNGGLFDPLNGYDWVKTDILLPNELFSNSIKTKEGDTGTGILDIFDRYNFTVKEDEPLEKEVAVDPEMLGKAYEKFNAIRPDNFEEYKKALKSGNKGEESKFNKQYGVYYTPREIVHYMCQQSLINYLFTECNMPCIPSPLTGEGKGEGVILNGVKNLILSKEDIETLIKYGEQLGENEATVEAKGKETKTYFYKLPESIRQNAKLIDDKLANIKVCDPAVGSGAFPVGMMSEIVKTRNVLSAYLSPSPNPSRQGRGNEGDASHQGRENYNESPLPLRERDRACPELVSGVRGKDRTIYNFKRHCIEKSLYGVDIDSGAVEIAKLRLWLSLVVDEDDIKNIKPLPNLDYKIVCGNSLLSVNALFHHQSLKKLEELKGRYFDETNPGKKISFKEEIDSLIGEITHNDKHFDYKVYFSEVFHTSTNPPFDKGGQGGFDVVIANPPYVDSERMVGQGQLDLRKTVAKTYKLTKGNWDIYIAFFEKGFNLLNSKGTLTFITPDKWISKPFGNALRINKISNLLAILKAGREVFEDVKVDAIVSLFTNTEQEYIYVYLYETEIFLKDKAQKKKLKPPYTLDALFSSGLNLIQKIDNTVIKLSDNFLCENACATSDAYKLKPFIHENRGSSINTATHFKMVNTGTIGKYFSKWEIQPMVYLGDEYLRPVVKRNEFFKNFKNAYSKKTFRPKIIIKGLNLLDAFLDNEGTTIPGKTTLIITNKTDNKDELKLLLAIINSSLIFYYIKEKYSASSYNQGITFTKGMINDIPLPSIDTNVRKNIIALVDQILAAKTTPPSAPLLNKEGNKGVVDTSALEQQIDEMVYKLYGLTEEDIAIVEGDN